MKAPEHRLIVGGRAGARPKKILEVKGSFRSLTRRVIHAVNRPFNTSEIRSQPRDYNSPTYVHAHHLWSAFFERI